MRMMFQYNAMCISLRVQRYIFFIRFSFNSGLADEKKAFFSCLLIVFAFSCFASWVAGKHFFA